MTPRAPLCLLLLLTACNPPREPNPPPRPLLAPGETRFASLRQLTFGGENGEPYWSPDGQRLVFQARPTGEGCDRIYTLDLRDPTQQPRQVSNGQGVTTCAFFFPGGDELLYASTHLASPACPPRPDFSQGYVWPLHAGFDIFRTRAAAPSALERLTDAPGYDAEATVCPVDGSIVFTSVRDGDLELYRMDRDGKNVVRLTHTPGYDGGAFFSPDCKQIVWRASRPEGPELEDYRALLARGLVRPTELELWVADADGSNARQVTYLGAASFAPYFFPSGKRILFSSNYGDPRGREFDLWAINVDGTGLERITFTPGFDGFPMFSPDGKRLAFASNRATAPGAHDTNLFVAEWRDGPGDSIPTAADRIRADIDWLAAPERQGRGVGTAGLEQAGEWLVERFRALGLDPAGDAATFRQPFEVVVGLSAKPTTSLAIGGSPLPEDAFRPLPFSSSGSAEGDLVFANYGVVAPEAGVDDYAGRDVKGKIVLVRRFVPPGREHDLQRHADLRYKAWVARERGARALLVVDLPDLPAAELPAEAPFPALSASAEGDASIPTAIVRRDAIAPHLGALGRKGRLRASLRVELTRETAAAFNVLGRLPANAPDRLPGVIVVGAHYDHLGFGGHGSLAPDSRDPHLGADDNASGVAALLEAARTLASSPARRRDMLFIAFSGEERGVLGSGHFVKTRAAGAAPIVAMLNMDMVGRLRDNRLSVLGGGSAEEWPALVAEACRASGVSCTVGGDGYGPSDHSPFFAAGVPVLHLFTGAHADYHKPSDSPELINAAGAAQVARIAADLALSVASRPQPLSYRKATEPRPLGDVRTSGASLGTIPDYAGPPRGQKGVLLAGVRQGGAADLAGMQRGDILVKLGDHEVGDVRDLMFALRALEPGDEVTAVVLRDGTPLELPVKLQHTRAH